MSLVFNPAVVSDDPAAAEAIIVNDGWFPNIDPIRLRSEARIRDSVLAPRLRKEILAAILTIGDNLDAWAKVQQTAGHAKLADVPSKTIDGQSRLQILYFAAIAGETKARIIEGYRDTDLTGRGDRKIEDLEPSVDELRRNAIQAVRSILGRTRTRIELI